MARNPLQFPTEDDPNLFDVTLREILPIKIRDQNFILSTGQLNVNTPQIKVTDSHPNAHDSESLCAQNIQYESRGRHTCFCGTH